MKIKLLSIFLVFFFSFHAMAKNIGLQQAEKVAKNFYYEKSNQINKSTSMQDVGVLSYEVRTAGDQNIYYVFHMKNRGFVMVSAEDYMQPVLAFSLDDDFVSENQPSQLKSWCNMYQEQITKAREEKLVAESRIAEKWNHYLKDQFSKADIASKTRSVEELLTSKWNQGWPYNSMCPIDGDGVQAVTGCVATGYAQCLYYWRFPMHGYGDHCYYHPTYGQLCADYEDTYYQWDAMSDTPHLNDSAVGELMYHCGVAVDMNYGPTSSGAWTEPESIEAHFGISPDFNWKERMYYSDTEWKNMMMEQLDQNYVIPYVGYSNSGGHFWVCDGYQDSDYFHMNWGWGGSSDGYYTLDNMQLDLNYSHQIGVNFYPDANNTDYPYYASGADTITYLEGSISDGSGPVMDYLNNTTATWLIDPQTEFDSIVGITIKMKRLDIAADGDVLRIYNGGDNTAPLLAELSGNEVPGTITSTSNKVFIELMTNADGTAPGFYLNFECDRATYCAEMTQLTEPSAVITDGSNNFYYSNSAFCIWSINPGIEGPLTLNFSSFDTEADNDILKVFDGSNQNLLATISGHYDNPPESVTSPSGRINMVFVTNSSVQAQGWEAWYDVSTGVVNSNKDLGFNIIPNPVNSTVDFHFNLTSDAHIVIDIYDMLGHHQTEVVNEKMSSGNQLVSTDLGNLTEGVYLCHLHIGNKTILRKIVKL
jgi:hypothetical protein